MKPSVSLQKLFHARFGVAPTRKVEAPGRLELLGNHTDYNEGLVMAIAIDRHVQMAGAPRPDGQISLFSDAFPEPETFFLDQIVHHSEAAWADYPKGVLLELQKKGVHFTGFNAAIQSSIPLGAGLSSSAAFEVATALLVRALFPFDLSATGLRPAPHRDTNGNLPPLDAPRKLQLALVAQAAENNFVGVKVGLLDQLASLFGKEGHVILIDCRTHEVTRSPLPPGAAIIVCPSGIKHALVGGEYNELRAHCESAARALGVRALRDVSLKDLQTARDKLTARQYECAYHIVGENQRVIFGDRALREGDLAQFGEYLFQSHASSRDFFHNSAPELDRLVELARQAPGCHGARLTGGGFGGATINLVAHEKTPDFIAFMKSGYRPPSPDPFEPMLCRIVDGAH